MGCTQDTIPLLIAELSVLSLFRKLQVSLLCDLVFHEEASELCALLLSNSCWLL